MKSDLEIAVLRDSQAFAALREEWKDLYENSPLSTPFQSWAWLYSWWEVFGEEGYELRLITVREGRLLVGLIPLMLEYWWGFRRLVFIGYRSDPMDILARKGWEDKVSEAGIRALRQMDSWHVMALRDVSPSAATWHIFQQWKGPSTHQITDTYYFIEVMPWDRLLASLSTKHRHTVRRTLRRAKEDDVRGVLAEPGEAEQAARRLVALHRELRQGRNVTWTHMIPEFESFIAVAARRMVDDRLGIISEFWQDGKVTISSFALFGDKTLYAYLIGVNQQAIRRYHWSALGIYDALNMARDRNRAYICLAQGREPYKQKWSHEAVPYYQAIFGRGRILWRLYLAYLSLRRSGVGPMQADSTPKMITNAGQRLKAVWTVVDPYRIKRAAHLSRQLLRKRS